MNKKIFLCAAGFDKDSKTKKAVFTVPSETFYLENSSGKCVYKGKTVYFGFDELSGDNVYTADFSDFSENGEYIMTTDSGCRSDSFSVRENAYEDAFNKVSKAFYFLRCGCGLDEKYAGVFAHEKCHTAQAALWNSRTVSVDISGGWHDAGDYGRYVTAGACALAHMLYAFIMFPEPFKKQNLNIPESGGTLPDILAECRVELDWLLKMQDKDGGVYHKATTAHHAAFIMPEQDTAQMFALPVSSMATADFAAVCALAARVYGAFDSRYSAKLLSAAEKSARWLEENPGYYFDDPKECTTGRYGERSDKDNRFWAWTELFASTENEKYHNKMKTSLSEYDFPLTALGYGSVGGFGALGYLLCGKSCDRDIADNFKKAFSREAGRLKAAADISGYGAAMLETDYCWGSSMNLLKHGMIFAIADRICGESEYAVYAERQLHVLLGLNALGFSYVSGIGSDCMKNPHYRPTASDGIDRCIPGFVSGGPNRFPCDESAKKLIKDGTPPMKCYADNVGAYSLNEITIYWNSPAVFLTAYLNDQYRNKQLSTAAAFTF